MTLSQIAELHDKLMLNLYEPSKLTPMGPPHPTPGPAVCTLPLLQSVSALETVGFFFYSRCSKTYVGDLPERRYTERQQTHEWMLNITNY